MLFDLKGKRKRLVQVVYVVPGDPVRRRPRAVRRGRQRQRRPDRRVPRRRRRRQHDSAFNDVVERAKRRAARNPDDPAAWLAVVRAQFNLASSPEGSDAETGALTDRGQQAVVEVTQAWERYQS